MINPLSDPGYLVPPLVVAGVSLGLLGVIVRYGRRVFARRLLACMVIGVALTGFFLFAMRTSTNAEQAVLWERPIFCAVYSTFVFFYHFILASTSKKEGKALLYLSYTLLVVSLALIPTNLIIERMIVEDYGYAPVIGPFAIVIIIAGLVLVGDGMRNLLKRSRIAPSQEERNRLQYLIIAAPVLAVGSLVDVLGPSWLPPVGIWTVLTFATIATIVVVKYHLLDIRIVVRKGLAYLLLSIMVAAPYATILLLLSRVTALAQRWWLYAVVIVLTAVLLRPLYGWAQRKVDKLFYRDRYDYLKALEQFGREAQSIKDLDNLGLTIVKLIKGALHSSSAALLLASQENGGFSVVSAIGLKNPPAGTVLDKNSLLINWMSEHHEIVSSKELGVIIELQNLRREERRNLSKLQAGLFVPVKNPNDELSGLLILGEKLSQQIYSEEDRRLLATIASQISVGLENAWLYSETQRSENALRENEEKLRLIFESMSEGITVMDLDANIVGVNTAQMAMYGANEKDELIGHNVLEFVSLEDRVRAREQLHQIVKTASGIQNAEYGLMTKNGEKRDAEVSVAVLREVSGSPTGLVAVVEDITDRKRDEAKRKDMERKAQLTSRLASVGEMASGIAHEINNPLTSVIGFSELMMKKNLPRDLRKHVETIYEGSQRVSGVVSRLLTFARQQKPERTFVNINEVIRNTLELRAYVLQTNNIEVTTRLLPELPSTMADAGQIQQMVLNIIVNAEKEMKMAHGKGKLLITTETVNNTIRMSFQDDGPGIPKQNVDKIFDPFFTTRRVGQGTGLGLSLCHAIVNEHDGQIYVNSELGKGATFFVELPVTSFEKPKQPSIQSSDDKVNTGRARILVVDDEPAILHLVKTVLEAEGHIVDTSNDSLSALEMIRSNRYNLILLDIKLPGMSGTELYKRIREIAGSLARRVVFITGDVMGSDTQNFISRNSAQYLAKPFTAEALSKEVNRILSGMT